MKPKWLLETDVFDENLERLVAEIKKQDMEVKVHRFMPFDSDTDCLKLYEPDDCVIFYGSLDVGKYLQRISPWVPGVYCTLDNYKCSHYYHIFGDLLLNRRYVMMPFGELNRRKFFLFNHLGEDNAVFLRPDRGDKIFTGQVCTLETWDKDFDLMSFHHTEPHEICVVAQPKNIIAEWRLIIANNKVIAGSEYKPKEISNVPESVLSFANHILLNGTISPDPVWVLDIAETDQHVLAVLEINSFSCSGLYGCNLEPIVREVSRIALQEWSDYNE